MDLNVIFNCDNIKLVSALIHNAITSVSWIEFKNNTLTLLINRVNWDYGGCDRKKSILCINNIMKFTYKLPDLDHDFNLYGDGFIALTHFYIDDKKMYIKSTNDGYISFRFYPHTEIILEDISPTFV